jgi:hypothetical protein
MPGIRGDDLLNCSLDRSGKFRTKMCRCGKGKLSNVRPETSGGVKKTYLKTATQTPVKMGFSGPDQSVQTNCSLFDIFGPPMVALFSTGEKPLGGEA